MGDFIDDIRADDQFIHHDEINNISLPPPVNVRTERGNIIVEVSGEVLYRGRDKDRITTAINGQLTLSPECRVNFFKPGIEGVVYTVRHSDGRIQRWFRADVRSVFQRRKAYASQNPNAKVSFFIL